MAVAANVAAVVHEDDSNLQRSLLDGEKDAAFKLAEHRKHWEKEWSELKGQFGLLADSASEVGVRLRESINELNRLLEEYARDGLQDVKRQIRETASQIRNGVRQRAGKVHTAVESARSKARSQLWLGVTALMLTIIGSAVSLWLSLPTAPETSVATVAVRPATAAAEATPMPTLSPTLLETPAPIRAPASKGRKLSKRSRGARRLVRQGFVRASATIIATPTPIAPTPAVTGIGSTPTVTQIRSSPSSNGSYAPLVAVSLMAFTIVGFIVNQLRTTRELEAQKVELAFNQEANTLRQTIDVSARNKTNELSNSVQQRNERLATELNALYSAVIDDCTKASEKIVPNLMTQVETGIGVALNTQKNVALTTATEIARSAQGVATGCENTARHVADQMQKKFERIVRSSGQRCAEAVNLHVREYRNLTGDFQHLISAVREACGLS